MASPLPSLSSLLFPLRSLCLSHSFLIPGLSLPPSSGRPSGPSISLSFSRSLLPPRRASTRRLSRCPRPASVGGHLPLFLSCARAQVARRRDCGGGHGGESSLPGVTCQPAALVHSRHFERAVVSLSSLSPRSFSLSSLRIHAHTRTGTFCLFLPVYILSPTFLTLIRTFIVARTGPRGVPIVFPTGLSEPFIEHRSLLCASPGDGMKTAPPQRRAVRRVPICRNRRELAFENTRPRSPLSFDAAMETFREDRAASEFHRSRSSTDFSRVWPATLFSFFALAKRQPSGRTFWLVSPGKR